MRKFKHVIPFFLALIMALAIPLAACDSCGEEIIDGKTKTLQSISVNADDAKTVYLVGDEFTAEGLKVTASFSESDSEELKEVTLEAGDYKVDSTAYKKDAKGIYPIKVSYTYESVTKNDTYEVEVLPLQDGLEVTLADGVEDTYKLSAELTTVEIDTSKIVVKEVNKNGTLTDVSGYTTKLYKGQEEVTLTDGKARVGGGAYAIWVEKESEEFPGYTRASFVLIYVNDDLDSFVWKSGDVSQTVGEDIISRTWLFTATYASGATKEISSKECTFSINTLVDGNKKTTVTYVEYNASGEKFTKTVQVDYTVEKIAGETTKYTYDFNAIDYSNMGNSGDVTLQQSDLTGVNSFLTIGSGKVTYRNSAIGSTATVLQIEDEGFLVTFNGVGKIIVGYSSTGSTNTSRVGVWDEEQNYLPAIYDENNSNIALDESAENVYLVTGTSVSEFTYVINKPGTYAIVSEKNAAYNRGSRIHSIYMEDTIPDEEAASVVYDVDFSDTVKFAAADLADSTVSAPVEIKDARGVSTGLSVTKSASLLGANHVTKIGTENGVQALQFQDKATSEQNSLVVGVQQGALTITVKYFSAADGRYIDVLSGDGNVLASSSANPTVDGEIVVATLQVTAGNPIYLGSHSSSINITYLKVVKA